MTMRLAIWLLLAAGFSISGVAQETLEARSNRFSPLAGLSDGFENGRLADFWLPGNFGSGRFVPERVKFSTKFARSGSCSVELTLREGDIAQPASENTITERTELDSGKYPLYGKEVCYGFSFLIPDGFPIRDVRLVISQIKQTEGDGPLIAQRFRDGKHTLTIENNGKKSRYNFPKIRNGQWNDMIFRVRYADPKALVEVLMNGKKVAAYTGPLGNPKPGNLFYHKIGLYRDKMPEPMTIYFDNYRSGPTIQSVDPAKFPKSATP